MKSAKLKINDTNYALLYVLKNADMETKYRVIVDITIKIMLQKPSLFLKAIKNEKS